MAAMGLNMLDFQLQGGVGVDGDAAVILFSLCPHRSLRLKRKRCILLSSMETLEVPALW